MSEIDNNFPVEARPEGNVPEDAGKVSAALNTLSKLSPARQVGLMLALAISVALGVAVVLWAQAPSYDLLFSGVAEKDSAEILQALDKLGAQYHVEPSSGAIMVPAGDVRELKVKLAAQGLPRSASLGYELLDKDNGFGTSKNVEMMRFQRALEGEIALTIQTIQNVKSAKVLLALPVQSVFVRERKKPSASVVVELFQGRSLEKEQIESIVHLVASSVPLMEAGQVTVVDQKGRLLNSKEGQEDISLTSKQFEYKKNIEEHLRQRIENILTPLVGNEGMRAQISADVDFTVTEKTQEMFNPDLPALRSEQTQEEQNTQNKVQGVPGALSNQPPPTGVAPEVASGQEKQANSESGSNSKSATRNYELDKTITHTRLATGGLRRLSVAVVVDDKKLVVEGAPTQQPYSQEELNQLRDLVKQAVGYDMGRGDQVTVSNVAFKVPEAVEVVTEPLWERPWFMDVLKILVAVLVISLLVFKVLRPVFATLIGRDEQEEKLKELEAAKRMAEEIGGVVSFDESGKPVAVRIDEETGEMQPALSAGVEDLLLLEAPQSYEKRLEYVQKLIDEDPKLVSQVIKTWLKKMAEENVELNRAQRASLLLLAVGQDRAASVLRHMGPKEVQLIGSTMAQLGTITSQMVDDVLEQFIIDIKNETGLGLDSDEYIRNMLTNALGADKAGSIIDRILLGANSKGIEQLKWMDTRSIADLIRMEHPQIISIILTLLDADQAADVLTLLPRNMRSDILMRIATLEGVQPAALRELDDIMEKQLTGSDGVKSSQIGGVDAAANILNFIESAVSDPMMQDINDVNADLAQRIQDKMFVFGDLVNIDDRGIQTLLREVSTDQLLLSMRGIDQQLRDKIFANMSRRAAEMLRDDLEAAPPARLSEVEAAQKDILQIAKRLADAGEIALGGGGGDEFV